MKRCFLLAGLLLACGETVSLGDGRRQNDAAADNAVVVHDAQVQDSVHEHAVWEPCAGRQCNEPCHVCDPADAQCVEPPEPHRCDPHGECTVHSVTCP